MKLLISEWGYIPLCFENTTTCLENLTTLDSDMVLVGNSPEMIKLRKLIFEISRSDESVLIRVETGTGKDLVAQILHRFRF